MILITILAKIIVIVIIIKLTTKSINKICQKDVFNDVNALPSRNS